MKKVYSKPDILFDSFSMSVSIAACAVPTTFSMGDCGYFFPSVGNIFMENVGGCDIPMSDGTSANDPVCYHTFADDKKLFSS